MTLWKSEVLALCRFLGLPEEMLRQSRCADRECGRPPWMAEEIEAIDRLLMIEAGELDPAAGTAIPQQLQRHVRHLLDMNGFKQRIPYRPDLSVPVTRS